MTSIRVIPRYVDHLWYPILCQVRGSNHCRIVEMQGKSVNDWNDMISRGQGVELIKNHFGLLKAGENMSDKGYSIGTKEGYDAFVEKRNAGNLSETLE